MFCRGPKQKVLYSLLLRYTFIVLILKFWNLDVAYSWCEHLIHCFFCFSQMLLVPLRITETLCQNLGPCLLLPYGLLANVMTVTIKMLIKPGLHPVVFQELAGFLPCLYIYKDKLYKKTNFNITVSLKCPTRPFTLVIRSKDLSCPSTSPSLLFQQ